jgi:hypothetical protein
VSFLAIPFLGPQNQPVLIFYADCQELNFFADDKKVTNVAAMCKGFCRLFDKLQEEPFLHLRNFPLGEGEPVRGHPSVYPTVQEAVDEIGPPKFKAVASFNYEAATA